MARFRKRPIVVEAEQWFPGRPTPGVCGDNPNRLCGCALLGGPRASVPHVHPTRCDAGVPLAPGDWVIAEQDGSGYYPCKPDVFDTTYEREA